MKLVIERVRTYRSEIVIPMEELPAGYELMNLGERETFHKLLDFADTYAKNTAQEERHEPDSITMKMVP